MTYVLYKFETSKIKNELKIENNNKFIKKYIQLEYAHRARQVSEVSSVLYKWIICRMKGEKNEDT